LGKSSALDSSEKITRQSPSRKRGIFAAGGFVHFIHDGLTDSQFVLLPIWAEVFGLNHAHVGLIKMCSAGALASLQVPAGILAEKFSERTILTLGTILAGIGFIIAGFATGYIGLLIGVLILGCGASTQHPLASALISRAYRGGAVRAALGTYNFTGDLGKVAVPFAVSGMIALWGWRESVHAYGTVVIVSGLLFFFMMGRLAPEKTLPDRPKVTQKGWGIENRTGFFVLSSISMIDSTCRMAFLTFMPFLLIGKGIAGPSIGLALGLVFAGGATGKLVCGLIAEKAGILRTVIVTELLTCLCILGIVFLPLPGVWFILPITGIALNGTSSVLYGTVTEFIDPDRLPRAYGLFYTLALGAGAAAPLLYGILSDRTSVDQALIVIGMSALLTLPLCIFLKRFIGQK
jgi:FSR family fosmidomycin resistance protein-like MFS transporter